MKKLLICFLFIIMGQNALSDPYQMEESVSLNKKQYDRNIGKISHYLINDKNMSFKESMWWTRNIVESSNKNNIDPIMYLSVIEEESGFNVKAVSSAGAIGPAQVMPRYWSHLCNLKDPECNIEAGAHVLSTYINDCGQVDCGLMMYNIGDRNYKNGKYLGSGKTYRNKIMNTKNRIVNT